MRFFEILLALAILISLVSLFYKPKHNFTKKILISILILSVLQVVFEGFRWQIIPIYIAILFIGLGFLVRNKKKFLRYTLGIIASLFFCIGFFIAAYALPITSFPNPTGSYTTAVSHSYATDNNRDERYADSKKRNLAYFTFYPTSDTKGAKRKYIPSFKQWLPSLRKKLGWPDLMLDYLKYLETSSIENGTPITDTKFPLVIYSHGLTNNYLDATTHLENLASYGYVVVAINHSYGADIAYTKDGALLKYKATEQLGDSLQFIDKNRAQRAKQWVKDAAFVIQTLKQNNAGNIDFSTIGMLGFSHGGTTASLALQTLPEIKAAVNLDGTPRGNDFETPFTKPHLLISTQRETFSDAQLKAWDISRTMVEAPLDLKESRMRKLASFNPSTNKAICVANTKHSNMIDYPLISPLSSQLKIGGAIDSKKCYDIVSSYIVNFFNEHLKGKKPTNVNDYQEVKKL